MDARRGQWGRIVCANAGYAPRNRVAALVTQIGSATYAPPAGYDSLPLAV